MSFVLSGLLWVFESPSLMSYQPGEDNKVDKRVVLYRQMIRNLERFALPWTFGSQESSLCLKVEQFCWAQAQPCGSSIEYKSQARSPKTLLNCWRLGAPRNSGICFGTKSRALFQEQNLAVKCKGVLEITKKQTNQTKWNTKSRWARADGQNVPGRNRATGQGAGSGFVSLLLWAAFQRL